MPSLNRISWLREKILGGVCCSVHSSCRATTCKVTFRLHTAADGVANTFALAILDHVEDRISSSVVTDKGHRSSSGDSIVVFYLRTPGPTASAAVKPPEESDFKGQWTPIFSPAGTVSSVRKRVRFQDAPASSPSPMDFQAMPESDPSPASDLVGDVYMAEELFSSWAKLF